ncbi:MAG TPA: glycosyl hydrolase family 28-related protein, partial [Thermoanaerobaculaceae bacterium]|nr:glycosyl hydrolase family 28-related protein [Thermoanaerobaculaceae bacterium]
GVHDDTAAIQAAIDALPVTGGVVFFPPGEYLISSTIVAGTGAEDTPSSRHNITLMGSGTGSDAEQFHHFLFTEAATRIVWGGAADGTMLRVAGPLSGFTLRDLMLDAADTAGMAVELIHAFQHRLEHVFIVRWKAWGVQYWARGPYSGLDGSAPPDSFTWEQVTFAAPALTTSCCLQVGVGTAADHKAGNISGVGVFRGCKFTRGTDTTAISVSLGWVDHLEFHNCYAVQRTFSATAGIALEVFPQTGHLGSPHAIQIFGGAWIGGFCENTTYGAWNYGAVRAPGTGGETPAGLLIWGYPTSDGEPLPPTGSNSTAIDYALACGFDDRFNAHGYHRANPMVESNYGAEAVVGGDALEHTVAPMLGGSTAILAGKLRPRGTTVRITAGGKLTADGSATLTARVYLRDSSSVNHLIGLFTIVPIADSDQPWWLYVDATVRSGGTSSQVAIGGGVLTVGGVVVGSLAVGTIPVSPATLDTDVGNVLPRVTFQWSAGTTGVANAETFTVDVVHRRVL